MRIILCALVLSTHCLLATAQPEGRVRLEVRRVVDGDTLIANGDRWRPTGFDAPETSRRNARCEREIELGKRATQTLAAALAVEGMVEAEPEIDRQTGGFKRDRSGRILARVFAGGRPLESALSPLGLAQKWAGPPEPKPNWCKDQPLFERKFSR